MYVEPWGRDDGDGGRTPPLSPTSADGSAAQATSRIKKLDAPTRQRHLQLWSTRQAADRWMTRRAQEKAYGDSAYGENEKKKKTQSAAHNLPTFTHELSADKFGFAFGGVDPGAARAPHVVSPRVWSIITSVADSVGVSSPQGYCMLMASSSKCTTLATPWVWLATTSCMSVCDSR